MLFLDFTVLFCRRCRRYRIEDDDQWFDKDAGLVQRLLARAQYLKTNRKTH
jgi:hypothetical protein